MQTVIHTFVYLDVNVNVNIKYAKQNGRLAKYTLRMRNKMN